MHGVSDFLSSKLTDLGMLWRNEVLPICAKILGEVGNHFTVEAFYIYLFINN
jgi:hypothetical protein